MIVHAVLKYSNGTINMHILLPPPVAIWTNVSRPGAYLGGVLGVLEHPPQPQAQY